jgi:hypothetical protein
MSKLSDVSNLAIRNMLGNRTLNKPTLAMDVTGGDEEHVQTTAAIEYIVDGIHYSKAILNAQSIAVTHGWNGEASAGYVQPLLKTAYYVLGLNSSGTVCCVQGNYAGQTLSMDPTVGVGQSVAGATWVGKGDIPDVPSGYTAFGIIKIALAGAATFTAGTTALNAANVTATFTDVAVLPNASTL